MSRSGGDLGPRGGRWCVAWADPCFRDWCACQPRIKSAVHKNRILTVTWTDDRKARFHDLWLRDSCWSGFDDGTSQRLHDSYKLRRDTRAAHVRASDDSVSIEWAGDGGSLSSTLPAYSISDAALKEKEKDEAPENRSSSPISVYPSSWLREHAYELRSQRRVQPITWGSELPSYFATPDAPRGGIRVFDYASFLNPGSDEFQEWLSACAGGKGPRPPVGHAPHTRSSLPVHPPPPRPPHLQSTCATTAWLCWEACPRRRAAWRRWRVASRT